MSAFMAGSNFQSAHVATEYDTKSDSSGCNGNTMKKYADMSTSIAEDKFDLLDDVTF